MSRFVTLPKHMIRGGSAKTTRGPERLRSAYGFLGPVDLTSGDLGFRVFCNHRERVKVPRARE